MNHATLGPGLLATTGKLSSRITTCSCSLYLYRIGDEHRRQRKLLNPAFNINHMREMIPVFYEVTHKVSFPRASRQPTSAHVVPQLRQAIESSVSNGATEINMVNWMGRTALELMGQAGLGYSFDPLVEDSKDSYGTALKLFV